MALVLNRAGLPWVTVLKRTAAFGRDFADFETEPVGESGTADRLRVLADQDIACNCLKIGAVIASAADVRAMHDRQGGCKIWLDTLHPTKNVGRVKLVQANVSLHWWQDHRQNHDEHRPSAQQAQRPIRSMR